MNKKFKFAATFSSMVIFCVLMMTGCRAPKDVAYFQNMEEIIPMSADAGQIKIMPFDKLAIVVKSKDPALSELFNLSVNTNRFGLTGSSTEVISSRAYSSGTEGMSNYTVTPSGDIDFPVLGMIHVEGMTREELAAFIKGELIGKGYVKDPVVTVEYVNTGFSVMGEVNNPGRFEMNMDRINVIEALSMAGDLTIQGKRNNIKLLRSEKDGVHTYSLDLTNLEELAKSPAYYLQQSDVIYVEPNDMRKRQTTTNGNNVLSASFWVSVASVLASLSVLIFK